MSNLDRPFFRWVIPVLVLPFYIWGLWHWPVWEAELWTLRTSTFPLPEMLRLVELDKHPPLFFLIEWLLLKLNHSDAMARVPAALAAWLSVIFAQRVISKHFSPAMGWFAALLLACSPFMMAYAANARSGTLTTLLSIICLSFSLDLVVGDRPRRAAMGLAIALVASLYVHYDMLMVWAGVALGGLGVLLHRQDSLLSQRLFLGGGAIGASGLAFLPWVLGPMQQQDINEKATLHSWQVLRYLWWPVGPEYIPAGATLGVLLAIFGLGMLWAHRRQRGMIYGWSIAAIAVPYAWSTNPGTLGKFYLYAPMQIIFVLLVAGSLDGLRRVLERKMSSILVFSVLSLGILGGAIRPMYDILIPRTNLVSVAPITPGIWDTRMDAQTLKTAPVGRLPGVLSEAGAAQIWLYYAPELDVLMQKPGEPPRLAWRGLARTDEPKQLAEYRTALGPGCLLSEAFADMLWVPPPRDCEILISHLGRIGEIEHYGPFLMEVAMQAYLKNDKARAEQYARGAAEDSPVSARANILLARILIESGDFEEAQSTLVKGLDKAARYKHREEWQELARLNATVARGLKDASAIKAAQMLQDCLNQHLFSMEEFLCE